mmetsp:Transcript_17322/g.40760  ORF Transcript_17322/g.40760 Transcript_17322/m.40760 type:complete len:268 (-) Transcript_17322:34-837(-)
MNGRSTPLSRPSRENLGSCHLLLGRPPLPPPPPPPPLLQPRLLPLPLLQRRLRLLLLRLLLLRRLRQLRLLRRLRRLLRRLLPLRLLPPPPRRATFARAAIRSLERARLSILWMLTGILIVSSARSVASLSLAATGPRTACLTTRSAGLKTLPSPVVTVRRLLTGRTSRSARPRCTRNVSSAAVATLIFRVDAAMSTAKSCANHVPPRPSDSVVQRFSVFMSTTIELEEQQRECVCTVCRLWALQRSTRVPDLIKAQVQATPCKHAS